MREKPRDWADVERIAGIQRTVSPSMTQRDVEILTRRRLKGPFWSRKLRKLR